MVIPVVEMPVRVVPVVVEKVLDMPAL